MIGEKDLYNAKGSYVKIVFSDGTSERAYLTNYYADEEEPSKGGMLELGEKRLVLQSDVKNIEILDE